jgi:hypothetical protein
VGAPASADLLLGRFVVTAERKILATIFVRLNIFRSHDPLRCVSDLLSLSEPILACAGTDGRGLVHCVGNNGGYALLD